ncbi:MAG: ectoine hydroxylase [Bacillaceae bacterium]|nr:ectoine hydroxylase [Bacillaceae bacterium]
MTDLYPSRVNDRPRILERKDPVIFSAGDQLKQGPLDQEKLDFYEKNGYLFFEKFFSDDEVQKWRQELRNVWEESKHTSAPEIIREPQNDEIRSVFKIHETNDIFNRLSRDRRILDMIMQLLGSEVYIHQSRINFKPGFNGKEFYWHSDFETWHVEDGMPRMRAISCSIALEDNYHFNGPLMVLPGSHKYFVSCVGQTPDDHYKQSLKKQEYGVPDHESLTKMVKEFGIDTPTGPAGSLLLFECNIMHGSNGNITPYPRSNIFMVYNSVENGLVQPFSGQNPRPDFLGERTIKPLKPIE